MKINQNIFRAYDIRGIVIAKNKNDGVDLTPEIVQQIGSATAVYMRQKYHIKNMLVGRDNRLHSENLQKAFIEGVLSAGVDVMDIGLITSPLMYYAVCRYGADSGVNITASHNPKEYNGIKIVRENAHSICGEELQEIFKIASSAPQKEQKTDPVKRGKLTAKSDIFEDYLKDIKKRMRLSRPLKVVIDAGNGVTGKFAPALLRAIGCEVIELYCELDGNFPHHEANPEEEKNMLDLSMAVVKHQADLGVGFDGDGDRVGVIDETGKHYSADYIILLLARDLLTRKPKSQIVFDVKVSNILIDEIKKLGGIPVMSKTGHSFIEARMHELNAPLGGEISGHMFFGKEYYDYYGFDDAFFAACKLLEILSKSRKAFSEQFKNLPKIETTPEFKAYCPDEKKFEIVQKLTDYFTREHKCITIDGVRVHFDDNAWGAVRCSNTSPNLTLRFEARTKRRLQEIQAIMVEQLKKYPEVDLSWYKR